MRGSCLCGAIGFELDRLDGPIGHCHCRTCRKAHSAPFATVARVRRDQFRWTRGENRLSQFESSAGKHRMFCSVCGSQLAAMLDGSDQLVLRVATLDDDPGERPIAHIWMEHDEPWLGWQALDEYQQFATR
nr:MULTISPECIES: GFA family protein [Sphingomonadales]